MVKSKYMTLKYIKFQMQLIITDDSFTILIFNQEIFLHSLIFFTEFKEINKNKLFYNYNSIQTVNINKTFISSF